MKVLIVLILLISNPSFASECIESLHFYRADKVSSNVMKQFEENDYSSVTLVLSSQFSDEDLNKGLKELVNSNRDESHINTIDLKNKFAFVYLSRQKMIELSNSKLIDNLLEDYSSLDNHLNFRYILKLNEKFGRSVLEVEARYKLLSEIKENITKYSEYKISGTGISVIEGRFSLSIYYSEDFGGEHTGVPDELSLYSKKDQVKWLGRELNISELPYDRHYFVEQRFIGEASSN